MDNAEQQDQIQDKTDLLVAVSLLRSMFDLRRIDYTCTKPRYDGLQGDRGALEFMLRHYSAEIIQGVITPSIIASQDQRLYAALNRVAKKQDSKRTVRDLFYELGHRPAKRMAERVHALAVVLGCSDAEAVTFGHGLKLHPTDTHDRPPGRRRRLSDYRGPDQAPALWRDDRLPQETPAAFIERIYGEWVRERLLTRGDLGWLDPALYEALRKWLTSNSLPEHLDMPSKTERAQRWAERVRDTVGSVLDTPNAARRYHDALRRNSDPAQR